MTELGSLAARGGSEQGTAISRREREGTPARLESPYGIVRRLSDEMDRVFANLAKGFGLERLPRRFGDVGRMAEMAWSPDIDVFERGGQLVVRADVPGLSKEDIRIDVDDDSITVSGERRQEQEERRGGLYRAERSYGWFSRTIPLPPGADPQTATARYQNGVLEVCVDLPEQKQVQARRIEIQEGPPPSSEAKARGVH